MANEILMESSPRRGLVAVRRHLVVALAAGRISLTGSPGLAYKPATFGQPRRPEPAPDIGADAVDFEG
jgi:hypothetical protein